MKNKKVMILFLCLVLIPIILALLNDAPKQYAYAGKKLSQEKGCADCHGQDGIAPNASYPELNLTPNLAGQSRDYLASRLVYIRDNIQRIISLPENGGIPDQMLDKVQHLSDEQIKQIAQYYSQLKPMYQQIKPVK